VPGIAETFALIDPWLEKSEGKKKKKKKKIAKEKG